MEEKKRSLETESYRHHDRPCGFHKPGNDSLDNMIGKTIHKQLEKERFDFNKAHTLLPAHHKNRGLNAERSMYVCMHNQTHTHKQTQKYM